MSDGTQEQQRRHLLLVDGRASERARIGQIVREADASLELTFASDVASAMREIRTRRFELGLVSLPRGADLESLKPLLRDTTGRVPPVAVIAPDSEREQLERALEFGAQDFFDRASFDASDVMRALRYAALHRELAFELRRTALERATQCPLTGVANRSVILDRGLLAIEIARRSRGSVALVYIGLDRLTSVNEGLGHEAGDEVLRTVAQRLDASRRASDTVGRVGSDEFALVLSGMARDLDASRVAERVLELVAQPITVDGNELRLTASAGIAVFPGDAADCDGLLQLSSVAMTRAKEQGAGTHRCYSADMQRSSADRLSREAALRRAIEDGELTLHYQPQVDLRSGELSGVEALARWMHSERGLLPPGEFLPLAEETGMIVDISQWGIREACQQMRRWEEENIAPPRISINVSLRQLLAIDFVSHLQEMLSAARIGGDRLQLEITEDCIVDDLAPVLKALSEVRELGVTIAMDDFGTGSVSLAALQKLPLDVLKIDPVFVRRALDGNADAVIASSIVNIAQALGLQALGEGVETVAMRDFLGEHLCTQAQGFLYAPALPPLELLPILRAGRVEPKES